MARRHRGNRFRVHWTPDRVIEKIHEWEEQFSEPPRRSDWDPTRCKVLSQTAQQKADIWRSRAFAHAVGDWPSVRTVVELFDTWNNAIEQAGLTPRLPSQRTARGATPQHFLTPLGHAMNVAYEAEDSMDTETLRVALEQVARIANELAEALSGDEAALGRAMGD